MIIITMILLLVIGYGFGCFSTGYIVGKIYGIDIRSSGSGNIGTTNALRTLGKKAGAFTFIGDVLKVLIPILLIQYFIFNDNKEVAQLFALTIGLGVVLGHNFPFYLNFKGGKGIAVSGGVIIGATNWKFLLIGALVFIIIVAITRYVSVGSLIVVWYIPVFSIYYYHGTRYFAPMLIVSLLFTCLAYIKHIDNIKRLLHGTENKLY